MKLAPLILAASLTFGGSAMAEDFQTKNTRTVTTEIEFDRAMLATPAGAEETYESIQLQARQTCRYRSYHSMYRTDFDCLYNLVDQAVGKINHPELSALHETSATGAVLAQR